VVGRSQPVKLGGERRPGIIGAQAGASQRALAAEVAGWSDIEGIVCWQRFEVREEAGRAGDRMLLSEAAQWEAGGVF